MKLLQKFPSYDYILKNIKDTFIRFPFVIISAVIGTIMAVYMIHFDEVSDDFVQKKLLMIAVLGLPLFISLTIFTERQGWKAINSVYLQIIGIAALAIYYFTLPEDIFSIEKYGIRFLLLNLGLHFLIAFLPYYKGNLLNGFWQYNKSLFLRFLTATMFSAVMYIGLTIALAAADHLFGIDIKEERYFQLWVLIVGIFHPFIFLAGFPKSFIDMNNISDYPKVIKVFTQYILLPLVILYFVILIIYEGKIIFTWNWPKGWVSHLVLWYSVVGILSMLFLHPLREGTGNRWIKICSKWFFRAMIPLLVMLSLAILRRISEYGITENRYFVIAMTIGLSIVVVYFIFSKIKDIRIIPIVICCLAFLSSFGPWGAFAISENSQKARLKSILVKNEMYSDNTIIKTTNDIPFEDKKEISSIISYLVDRHGTSLFENMFPEGEFVLIDSLSKYEHKKDIANLMGFEFVSRWELASTNKFYSFNLQNESILDIAEFDQFISVTRHNFGMEGKYIVLDNDSFLVNINKDSMYLEFTFENDSTSRRLDFRDHITDLLNTQPESNKNINTDKMIFDLPGTNPRVRLLMNHINGNHHPDSLPTLNALNYYLLIDRE